LVTLVKKAIVVLIILSIAWHCKKYYFFFGAGAFSGTLVPSNFLCTLTFLHTCLPFTSWQTRLTSASARACGIVKTTSTNIATHAIKLNDLIVFLLYYSAGNDCDGPSGRPVVGQAGAGAPNAGAGVDPNVDGVPPNPA
jgi:hypothetical protein